MKRKNRIVLCGILAVMMAFVMAMPVSANAEISQTDVASIGDEGYATLQEAFNAVQDGDTIELLKDIEVNEGSNGVPLRYNYDKPEKPRRIKGFEVFSLIFSSFSKPKNHTEISRIAGGVSLTTNE